MATKPYNHIKFIKWIRDDRFRTEPRMSLLDAKNLADGALAGPSRLYAEYMSTLESQPEWTEVFIYGIGDIRFTDKAFFDAIRLTRDEILKEVEPEGSAGLSTLQLAMILASLR